MRVGMSEAIGRSSGDYLYSGQSGNKRIPDSDPYNLDNLADIVAKSVSEALTDMGSSVPGADIPRPLTNAMSWVIAPVVERVETLTPSTLQEMSPALKTPVSRLTSSLSPVFGTV